MKQQENLDKYNNFRKKYNVFEYSKALAQKVNGGVLFSFEFRAASQWVFRPKVFLPSTQNTKTISEQAIQALAFNVGMVELISYWKAFCSPTIVVKPYRLTLDQEKWWKKLFRYGLGEFFYTNGIDVPGEDMVRFEYPENAREHGKHVVGCDDGRILIPVGGGKDSAVTLELLKKHTAKPMVLVVNHREATRQVVRAAGLENENVLEVCRTIDPLLLDLNKEGFLNGHTPFSALLAFVTVTAASLEGIKHVVLSNESSANEPTIPGTIVNHQYSKSLEFELDFRRYLGEHLLEGVNYFSFLRPLNELQIAALFAKQEKYHEAFRSCNVGSKTDEWCCNCSKCLFTYIILSPFLKTEELTEIFGQNLFENPELTPTLEELSGISENKPFECVGTVEEVNAALIKTILNRNHCKLPPLLWHYQENRIKNMTNKQFENLLTRFEETHCLLPEFEAILRRAIK